MRALVLSLVVLGCASPAPEEASAGSAIQGGVPTRDDAAVGLLDLGAGYCTATLIAPNVVLTAGHCIGVASRMLFHVDGERYAVAEAIEHPDYDFFGESTCPTRTPDVGLVRLARSVVDVTPVAWSSRLPRAGETCRITGYGAPYEREKRTATSIVVSAGDARIHVRFGTGIADRGDSGGPLLCGERIVGVVSCHPDEDTHLTEYYQALEASWLEATIERWTSSSPSPSPSPLP